ncbi:MAG: hypothetical protein R3313_03700 [Candidatus Saccharimonadales bacterium]|nr:hypothetical protein [Candidatus Saccharimonadales bacterium]
MEFVDRIIILQEEESGNGWRVVVQIGENSDTALNYNVQVDEEIYERLTGGNISPGDLVEESFKYLLEHEDKHSILKDFDLDVITTYFPSYEKEIVKRL